MMLDSSYPGTELGNYESGVNDRLRSLAADDFVERLWKKDTGLWVEDEPDQLIVSNSLGWLDVATKMEVALGELSSFAEEVLDMGFEHVVCMGMGGSSLCPLVFERSFPVGKKGLPLTVLDTTDPATVLRIESGIPLDETLFCVASKSGTTAEPLAFEEYFYDKLREVKGGDAGANMAVITDPGSRMVARAEERGYLQIFLNFPDIGGRFSALSYFGLVPAALLGVDLGVLLARTVAMSDACRAPEHENPGVILGAIMGELARQGRDKVTLFVPGELETLGAWLEQLLAESTGKHGTGLVPVAGEPPGDPDAYGEDRLFINVSMPGDEAAETETAVEALAAAGQPVVRIAIDDRLDLGAEFYRWEIATATAGSVLGINAFDQPNVQESKDNTNRLLDVVSSEGGLPTVEPAAREGVLTVFCDQSADSISEALSNFLSLARRGDYLAILAFISENKAADTSLSRMRVSLRDGLRLATTTGYGPRYLHSTGQLHKGGPGSGMYLLLTGESSEEVPIPGTSYGFPDLRDAQALGDMEALQGHGRRVLRIDLGSDTEKGLASLEAVISDVLGKARLSQL